MQKVVPEMGPLRAGQTFEKAMNSNGFGTFRLLRKIHFGVSFGTPTFEEISGNLRKIMPHIGNIGFLKEIKYHFEGNSAQQRGGG